MWVFCHPQEASQLYKFLEGLISIRNCQSCLHMSNYHSNVYVPFYCICENFRLINILPSSANLCIAEVFDGINFCQCVKGRHILYVIINTGQRIHLISISPVRADGEIDENFLLPKASVYTLLRSNGGLHVCLTTVGIVHSSQI